MKQIGIALMVAGIAMVSWFGYQYWSSTQSVTKLDSDVVKDSAETEDSSTSDDLTSEDGGKAEDERHANVDYEDGDEIAQLVMPSIDLSFEVFWGTGEDALSTGGGMYDREFNKPPAGGGQTTLTGQRGRE